MSQEYSQSKILLDGDPNQSLSSQQLEQQVRALEEEIEMTIFNYESLLQVEKKNSADRSEFLLFLIQSTRAKHQEELQALQTQLHTAVAEKEEAQNLEKQMESIGEGVDSIVEEGKRLKLQNEALQRELEEQEAKERDLDEEISSSSRELEGYRQKIDEWERTKIKWNRRRKELLEMVNEAERQAEGAGQGDARGSVGEEKQQLNGLINKYKNNF